ncbi:MAG: hypothetical protein JWM96_592 [Alphaproteobacteria bacterium]|nr:hypothetical protein [Alphaproteobacteria bacterium]
MNPALFDIIIIVLVLLSIALGFLRGFCNEVFTIFGWIAAIVATIYFMPVLRPYGRELIHKEWLADIATSSAIFFFTLAVFSALSHFATRTLHASRLGIVDRSAGFVFGMFRAVVLLGLGYMLFTFAYGKEENRPDFVKEARTRPFLEASAGWVQAIFPIENILGGSEEEKADDKKPEDEKEKKDGELGDPREIGAQIKEEMNDAKKDVSEAADAVSDKTKELSDKAKQIPEKAKGAVDEKTGNGKNKDLY